MYITQREGGKEGNQRGEVWGAKEIMTSERCEGRMLTYMHGEVITKAMILYATQQQNKADLKKKLALFFKTVHSFLLCLFWLVSVPDTISSLLRKKNKK